MVSVSILCRLGERQCAYKSGDEGKKCLLIPRTYTNNKSDKLDSCLTSSAFLVNVITRESVLFLIKFSKAGLPLWSSSSAAECNIPRFSCCVYFLSLVVFYFCILSCSYPLDKAIKIFHPKVILQFLFSRTVL
jgi:hypothetical protein